MMPVVLIIWALYILLAAVVLWQSGVQAQAGGATYGRALAIEIANVVVRYGAGALFAGAGGIIASVLAFGVMLFLIKTLFECDWGEALAVWVINIIAWFAIGWLLMAAAGIIGFATLFSGLGR
ncbi:MAG: hypothetical protein ACREJQ_06695 [bacterium]